MPRVPLLSIVALALAACDDTTVGGRPIPVGWDAAVDADPADDFRKWDYSPQPSRRHDARLEARVEPDAPPTADVRPPADGSYTDAGGPDAERSDAAVTFPQPRVPPEDTGEREGVWSPPEGSDQRPHRPPITPEVACDALDDDADGVADEGFDCRLGAQVPCETPCGATGVAACVEGCTLTECVPPAETCNGQDDDCDGRIDQGFECIQGQLRLCNPGCARGEYQTCLDDCTWTPCPAAPGCADDGTVCDVDLDRDGFMDPGSLAFGHWIGGDGYLPHWDCLGAYGAGCNPVIEGGAYYVRHGFHWFRRVEFPFRDWDAAEGPAPLVEYEYRESREALVYDRRGGVVRIPLPGLSQDFPANGTVIDIGPMILVDRIAQVELYDLEGNLLAPPLEGFRRPEFSLRPEPPGVSEASLPAPGAWFRCGELAACVVGGFLERYRAWWQHYPDDWGDWFWDWPPTLIMVRFDFAQGTADWEEFEVPGYEWEFIDTFDGTTNFLSWPVPAPDGRSLLVPAFRPASNGETCCGDPAYEYALHKFDETGFEEGEYHPVPLPPGHCMHVSEHSIPWLLALATSPTSVEVRVNYAMILDRCDQETSTYATVELNTSGRHRNLRGNLNRRADPNADTFWTVDGLGSRMRWDDHVLLPVTRRFSCTGRCEYGPPMLDCGDDLSQCHEDRHVIVEERHGDRREVLVESWDGRSGLFSTPIIRSGRDGMPFVEHAFYLPFCGGACDLSAWGDTIQPVECAERRRLTHAR